MQRDRERELRNEERLLADLRRVANNNVHSAIRLNYWFFTFSFILIGVTGMYLLVNGWPRPGEETKFFLLMLIGAWASMLLSILWGRRVWLKD